MVRCTREFQVQKQWTDRWLVNGSKLCGKLHRLDALPKRRLPITEGGEKFEMIISCSTVGDRRAQKFKVDGTE